MADSVTRREWCKGCGYCVHYCPAKALEIGTDTNAKGYPAARRRAEIECTGCMACALVCPDAAIEIYR